MPKNASERKEAMAMLARMPCGIVLFDRGYPSYALILYMMEKYAGHFLFRCPASNTIPAVVSFLASGADDGVIHGPYTCIIATNLTVDDFTKSAREPF